PSRGSLEHWQGTLCRDADHDDVYLMLDVRHRRIAPEPLELLVLRIDRKDLARVSVLHQRSHGLRAGTPGIVRDADNGDRLRLEKALEVIHEILKAAPN